MIGYLKGDLFRVIENRLIVNCNGVGYAVMVKGMEGFKVGEEVQLWIHTHVKEDMLALFGFKEEGELLLFERLLTISGVGPKVALNVLRAGSPIEIQEAIRLADVNFLTRVPGIGKKGAQRIIVELKSKLVNGKELMLKDSPQQEDAVLGLMSLGFLKEEAREALKKVDPELPAEEQIKLALKNG